MADALMSDEVRIWIEARGWGMLLLRQSTVSRWEKLPVSGRQRAVLQGWRRADVQRGTSGDGVATLTLVRAFLELLRERFPDHANLFQGWTTPPTSATKSNLSPPNGSRAPLDASVLAAIARIENDPGSFSSDDDFGLYVETRDRPTPDNPFAVSADSTAGLVEVFTRLFQDSSSPVDLGRPQLCLGNARYWQLRGWVDARWTEVRRALGLADDPAFRASIDAEKARLLPRPAGGGLGAIPTMALMTALDGPTPAAVADPLRESLATRFHRLTATTPVPQSLSELQEYLRVAIELEHFTIPIYLTAMWSLRRSEAGLPVRKILTQVVMQEMLHMGLAANILVAIGGEVMINHPDRIPVYPDVLPGIDDPTLFRLEAFSRPLLDKFLRLEEPQHGPIPAQALVAISVPKFPTIGDFYDAIETALVTFNPTFKIEGQVSATVGVDELFLISNLEEARRAIQLIKQQGEGSDTSQGAVDFGGGLAHYYQFDQIVQGKTYVPQPDLTFKLDPNLPIAFPTADDVFPMAPVPSTGYVGVTDADEFDQAYSNMVDLLQQAWTDTDPDQAGLALGEAFGLMQASLAGPALRLMNTPRPPEVGSGNYGPAFRYTPAAPTPSLPPEPGEAPVPVEPPPVAAQPGYARIQQILEEAVAGETIGVHGSFWQTLTRDQFVTKSIFGKRLIVTRPDGLFDPDESNLVKALEGRPPFGADLDSAPDDASIRRMPAGLPPVSPDQIGEIRAWIVAGCPDQPTTQAGSPI